MHTDALTRAGDAFDIRTSIDVVNSADTGK